MDPTSAIFLAIALNHLTTSPLWLITHSVTSSFVNNCFDGIRKMSKICPDLAPDIVAHLSAFSDAGQRIFSGRWQDAQAEFGSIHINISDENGATKSDKKAAAERTFDGKEMHFWWHSKIEPHRDRIHICPG